MNNQSPNTKNSLNNPSKNNYPFLRWLIILLIAILAIYFLTKPLRISSANHYIESGDRYLLQKAYLKADLEYQKALTLNNNQDAIERKSLVSKAMQNVSSLNDFYINKNATAELNLLNEASAVPKTESDAVKESKKLIEQKEYQLAIIPAKTAIEMDRNYRDSWLYLGIANLKCAEYLELRSEVKSQYLSSAKDALDTALRLDPEYQPTKDYLKELDSQTVN